MSAKTYVKNANPIEFTVFDSSDTEKYTDFLKDDTKNQVSFENGEVKVHTDWGDYSGKDGYIIAKYGPGDYNLIEPAVFEKSYEVLSDNTAVKVASVEAIEFTGKNFLEVLKFAGDKVELNGGIAIQTLEGVADLKEGDYILKGVNGEFYPNDKETFEKNYREVGANVEVTFENLFNSMDEDAINVKNILEVAKISYVETAKDTADLDYSILVQNSDGKDALKIEVEGRNNFAVYDFKRNEWENADIEEISSILEEKFNISIEKTNNSFDKENLNIKFEKADFKVDDEMHDWDVADY